MPVLQLLALNALISAGLFIALWRYSLVIKDPSFIDSWWALGMVVIAITSYLLTGGQDPHRIALTAICTVWGLRLGLYLLWRWRKDGPDRRYDTMMGKAIRAVTQDKRAARVMGINVEKTFLFTFGIGAALAGMAGALLTPIYSITPGVGGNFILAAFAVVVLGGLGSVWGAYIGGLIVGVVEAFAGYYIDPSLKNAIWFIIFLVVLIVRPAGLMGQVGAEEVGFREQN